MQTLPDLGSSEGMRSPEDEVDGAALQGITPDRSWFWRWLAESWMTILVVGGATLFVCIELRPDLLFSNSLDVGGDNAAHVVAPYYLIHDLLPHGQITGWDPQWFNGFPLYVFYFPLPALFVGFLSLFFHYAVAFKLVTVAGSISMPIAAYLFGRLAGLRRPIPEFFALTSVVFLFNTSFTIDGGNIASTMAGEFSFSLAVSMGMLFLGTFVYSLRTGRKRWVAALLLCATVLCHVVPGLFCAGTAVVFAIAYRGYRPIRTLVPVGIVGGMLAAVWLLPFGAYLRYSSSMGYQRVPGLFHQIFPMTGEILIQVIALLGACFAVMQRQRLICALSVVAIGSALAFQFLPSGLVYNGRWLPFWFLTTSLIAGYGFAELLRALFNRLYAHSLYVKGAPILGGCIVILALCSWLGILPIANVPAANRNFIPSWVSWNYSGYQAKPGWAEYSRIVTMLDHATATYGCGRLDYEYSPNVTNYFGSTLAPMAFPLFTNGCVDVAEGLYYESSTSTPFHFLDQAEVSLQPSNPVVGIPYQQLDVADGIRHLQLQGITYFLANSPRVEQQAAIDPALVKIGSTPANPALVDGTPAPKGKTAWILYRIKNAPLVQSLNHLPVVEQGLSKTLWLSTAISWYQDESYWDTPITASGPLQWPAGNPGALVAPNDATKITPTKISNIATTNGSIAFDVARTGVPVLVKVPYFPNWHVTGATGPYESTPNFMIVVPTAHHVVLHYGTTNIDTAAKVVTGFGIIGLIALGRNVKMPELPKNANGNAPQPEVPDADDVAYALEFTDQENESAEKRHHTTEPGGEDSLT